MKGAVTPPRKGTPTCNIWSQEQATTFLFGPDLRGHYDQPLCRSTHRMAR